MEFNEYTVAHKPEKPFLLILEFNSDDINVSWHETIEDLQSSIASYRKDFADIFTVNTALEICACKEIAVENMSGIE